MEGREAEWLIIVEMDSQSPREVADFALKIMECPVEVGNC